MSMRLENGVIHLDGVCRVEEAEELSALLQADIRPVDLSECRQAHAAVLQALLAFSPPILGLPADPLLQQALRTALRPDAGPVSPSETF